jgi:phosphatidylinositol-3-phosphatase
MIRNRLVAVAVAASVAALGVGAAFAGSAHATTLSLCGNAGQPTSGIKHVLVVMLENKTYSQVIGKSSDPNINVIANQCGSGTETFGLSHTSAANYLGVVSGTSGFYSGCATVKACTTTSPNLFAQIDAAGLSWKSYQESNTTNCQSVANANTKIGHDPALFFALADCPTNDVPVADLTAASGALYNDLSNQTLPSFGWITPNLTDDADVGSFTPADTWLGKFIPLVQSSPAYQAGNTLLIVTNDEGYGSDDVNGEDCTNQTADLAKLQESCHVPSIIVYPWASGPDKTFFDHYSITRTVEDLFGLAPIGGAATASSMVGHYGIAVPASPSPTPTTTSASPSPSPTPTTTSPSPSATPTATTGYQVVRLTQSVQLTSGTTVALTTVCSPGQMPVGGGYQGLVPGDVTVTGSFPAGPEWEVDLYVNSNAGTTDQVQTYAICLNP